MHDAFSSVMIVSSLAACTNNNGGEGAGTGTGTSTTVEVKNEDGTTSTVEVADTTTGTVNTETGAYEVKDLYITVDGTLTANVDNGQDAFIQQWEEAVSAKLGHDVKLHINQPDHSGYASNVAGNRSAGRWFLSGCSDHERWYVPSVRKRRSALGYG